MYVCVYNKFYYYGMYVYMTLCVVVCSSLSLCSVAHNACTFNVDNSPPTQAY